MVSHGRINKVRASFAERLCPTKILFGYTDSADTEVGEWWCHFCLRLRPTSCFGWSGLRGYWFSCCFECQSYGRREGWVRPLDYYLRALAEERDRRDRAVSELRWVSREDVDRQAQLCSVVVLSSERIRCIEERYLRELDDLSVLSMPKE